MNVLKAMVISAIVLLVMLGIPMAVMQLVSMLLSPAFGKSTAEAISAILLLWLLISGVFYFVLRANK